VISDLTGLRKEGSNRGREEGKRWSQRQLLCKSCYNWDSDQIISASASDQLIATQLIHVPGFRDFDLCPGISAIVDWLRLRSRWLIGNPPDLSCS